MASAELGADDYATSRVPQSQRRPWFGIAVQRFGNISDLAQFLMGAILGFGMTFWEAFWVLTVATIILEAVAILLGIIGMREGLNTSTLARWTGLGRGGSAVLGLTICISMIGWFGIQSGISGEALAKVFPTVPASVWAAIFGLAISLVAFRGFHSMQKLANITVPLFLLIIGWAFFSELQGHSIGSLLTSPAPGPHLDFVTAVTVVAGSYIVGALTSPDMTRFNRSTADVIKQSVLGVSAGNYVVGLAGVIMAHALNTYDITGIIFASVGWLGAVAVLVGTSKINAWNGYSASLGIVAFFDAALGIRINRPVAALVSGVLGTALGAVGFLDRFTDFLEILGVAFPAVIGIILAEYFVIKKWRPQLDMSREQGTVPNHSPNWIPASLIIWLVSAAIGYYTDWGIPVLNSVLAGFALYCLAGKLGLLASFGDGPEPEAHQEPLVVQKVEDF
ncbi:purine-cytosine permease family protein [Prescottella agglutinans]|uniref:Cytosine permease n=1 Tax=Prescottella agglutinans TaxID=1644129 RepID=A0ABT6MG64_9NOCA|nr:cytosine permease [Prescottella agglutinans]MDH6283307.1 cytosine permease [Prescottella agglutinans]